MLKRCGKFRSPAGKRRILAAGDEIRLRQVSDALPEDICETVRAEDGQEALSLMREAGSAVSLVLLDFSLKDGNVMLAEMKSDPSLCRIPVIALTSGREEEEESMRLGAADIIPQTVPAPSVIRARILRTIRLYENDSLEDCAMIADTLSSGCFMICTVDPADDSYALFGCTEEFESLQIAAEGKDFFKEGMEKIAAAADEEDRGRIRTVFTKENVLHGASEVTLTCRMMIGKEDIPARIRAVRYKEDRIVIIISDAGRQVRREEELLEARRLASRDALTGVKSRHAYRKAEAEYTEKIKDGLAEPFGIVMCDVNGLKSINDTYGHAAGDEYLKKACRIICDAFKHSPVYRVGGDEFAVILNGRDYEQRTDLMEYVRSACTETDISIAAGIALWNGTVEMTFADVFRAADASMYADKEAAKN